MPTIEQNQTRWTNFAWAKGGDEWSGGWGGTDRLWHATIWPRIGAFLPANRILEIAPGHGRVTHFLVGQCEHLVLVDLVESCIEGCRERLADCAHVEYHVNDGATLPCADVDLAISWDSLVHAERDVVASYLKELARVLRPGGVAFLHHSNLAAHRDADTGVLAVKNAHWRAESVSAEIVRADAATAGLEILAQEIVCWGGSVFNDCFSLVCRPSPEASTAEAEPIVVENYFFGHEAQRASTIAAIYAASPGLPDPPLIPTRPTETADGSAGAIWGAGA